MGYWYFLFGLDAGAKGLLAKVGRSEELDLMIKLMMMKMKLLKTFPVLRLNRNHLMIG